MNPAHITRVAESDRPATVAAAAGTVARLVEDLRHAAESEAIELALGDGLSAALVGHSCDVDRADSEQNITDARMASLAGP